jgi:hypothetical protein
MDRVIVRIQRALLVPTNPGSRYERKVSWRPVKKIDYEESARIFRCIGGKRSIGIETDAQFAKWLVDNFGNGRYQITIFKKKVRGWTFMSFDCQNPNKFCQVRKNKSKKAMEKEALTKEWRIRQREMKEAQTEEEKEDIKSKLENLEEMAEVNEMTGIDLDNCSFRTTKIKIFKTTMPPYHEHAYQEYGPNIYTSSTSTSTDKESKTTKTKESKESKEKVENQQNSQSGKLNRSGIWKI